MPEDWGLGSLYILMNGYLQFLLSVSCHVLPDGMGAQCDASQEVGTALASHKMRAGNHVISYRAPAFKT